MRPTDHRHGAFPAEEVAQGVRGVSGFGEGADKNQIHVVRQRLRQVFQAGVADEGNVMSAPFTPNPDHLRHDAGKIGIHDAGEQSLGGTP